MMQEQAPGVYQKSLRNMWVGVTLFNPLISLLSLCVFPLHEIRLHKETLLAEMGYKVRAGPTPASIASHSDF